MQRLVLSLVLVTFATTAWAQTLAAEYRAGGFVLRTVVRAIGDLELDSTRGDPR